MAAVQDFHSKYTGCTSFDKKLKKQRFTSNLHQLMQKSVQARKNRIIWNISRKTSTSKASICFHLMWQRQNQGVRSTATAKPLDFGVIN